MRWWRRHWRWVLALGATIIGLVVVFLLYITAKRREAERLRAELALLRAGAKVEGLKAEKAARRDELARNAEARDKLDVKIAEAKREAVSKVSNVEGLGDLAVSEEFRKLGY